MKDLMRKRWCKWW